LHRERCGKAGRPKTLISSVCPQIACGITHIYFPPHP
jgi:hypothetical protein